MHTFADPLKRAVQVAPDKVALVDGKSQITFQDLWWRCAQLIGGLQNLGCERGDRVAILSANSHQYIEAYVGIPAGGLVIVPLNTRHAEPELEYALKDAGAKVLLTDRDPGALAKTVQHVVDLGSQYEALLDNGERVPLGEGIAEEDLAGLFYTGGTTGASKGVMLTHRNLLSNTFNWMASVPQRPEDVFLVQAPLFHAAGSNGVLASIWNASTQVILGAFSPGDSLDLIEEYEITQTLGVPTMLAGMAEEQHTRPRDTSSLEVISHGGSPVATEVVKRTCSAFPTAELVHIYGATELSPLCTALLGEEKLVDGPRARSCGQSIPGCEVRILDDDGKELPRGEIGEVVVRGATVMKGYWNKPEQTDAVLKEGAYWTGDLGYMDDGGFVFLVDRSKDMIVSGGENVYCTEVEEVLYKHPAVLEAAAFGVPDEKWGEAVHAVVVPRPEHNNVDPSELIAFCSKHIAGYKIPKGIDIRLEPLPISGPGKVLKRELRAPFWEGKDSSVN
jgi:acyl-CoA synthetase (AMP-forming)/AMP-acid ligase II